MIAPEPYLSACLTVLQRSLLACRMWGWAGQTAAEHPVSPAHLADLMDALHNIPELLRDWERCDVELLRGMLGDYELKWRDHGGLALLQVFDGIVAGEDV
jgi:hypothetical protein